MENGAERDDILSQKRKPGWVFNGYMAFVMYGPLALDRKYKSNIMVHTGEEKMSRKLMREEQKENVDEKVNDFSSIVSKKLRYVSTDKIIKCETKRETQFETNNFREAKLRQRDKEQGNLLLIQLVNSKNQQLQTIMQMNYQLSQSVGFGPSHPSYKRYEDNLKRIDVLLDEIDKLNMRVEDVYNNATGGNSKQIKKCEANTSSDYTFEVVNFETPAMSKETHTVTEHQGEALRLFNEPSIENIGEDYSKDAENSSNDGVIPIEAGIDLEEQEIIDV
jgi:hypothetical protein